MNLLGTVTKHQIAKDKSAATTMENYQFYGRFGNEIVIPAPKTITLNTVLWSFKSGPNHMCWAVDLKCYESINFLVIVWKSKMSAYIETNFTSLVHIWEKRKSVRRFSEELMIFVSDAQSLLNSDISQSFYCKIVSQPLNFIRSS